MGLKVSKQISRYHVVGSENNLLETSEVGLKEESLFGQLGEGCLEVVRTQSEMNLMIGVQGVSDIRVPKASESPPDHQQPNTFCGYLTQVSAAISVSLTALVLGFSTAYTSPALVSMNEPNNTFHVSPEDESWIGSLLPLFALMGGILGGLMIDSLGRITTIQCTSPLFCVSFLLIALASRVVKVMVGRAIGGLCVGIASLALPIYLGETLQPEVRGSLGLLPSIFGNGGIVLCFVAGKYLNWSKLAFLGVFLPILSFSWMIFVPETPRWYISKHKHSEAANALKKLRGKHTDISAQLEDIQQTNRTAELEKCSTLAELFSKRYFWPLSISIGLMFFQQMSGINAVIFYTVKIFQDAGSSIDSNFCAIIVAAANCGSTFIAATLIDRLGRKILLKVSSITMIVTLVTLGTYFYLKKTGANVTPYAWLPLASIVVFVVGFSIGFGPIPWLMMGEILPARIKDPAASVVTAFNWMCTFIVTKTFSNLINLFGSHGTFWFFSFWCVISLIFVSYLVPETRGKKLEDIELYFVSRCKNIPSALTICVKDPENDQTSF